MQQKKNREFYKNFKEVFMKRGVCVLFSFLLAASVGLIADTSHGAGPGGAKALFYSGEGTTISRQTAPAPTRRTSDIRTASVPSKVKYMGVTYWIEKMGRDGELRRVSTKSTFRAGDRIRVSLKSNREGYLYVVNLGSTGASTLLFPNASTPQGSNFIQANQTYDLPPNSFFRFDANPGEEILLVMLSPTPIGSDMPGQPPTQTASTGAQLPPAGTDPNIPPPPSGQDLAGQQPPPPPAIEDSTGQPPPPATDNMVASASGGKGARGSRDLFVEGLVTTANKRSYGGRDMYVENDNVGPTPATYVVAPVSTLEQERKMITLKIRLRHR